MADTDSVSVSGHGGGLLPRRKLDHIATWVTGYPGLLMASPRTADPAIVGRAIEEIGSACRGGQVKLALMLLGRLIPEFEHNADGSAGEVRA